MHTMNIVAFYPQSYVDSLSEGGNQAAPILFLSADIMSNSGIYSMYMQVDGELMEISRTMKKSKVTERQRLSRKQLSGSNELHRPIPFYLSGK